MLWETKVTPQADGSVRLEAVGFQNECDVARARVILGGEDVVSAKMVRKLCRLGLIESYKPGGLPRKDGKPSNARIVINVDSCYAYRSKEMARQKVVRELF